MTGRPAPAGLPSSGAREAAKSIARSLLERTAREGDSGPAKPDWVDVRPRSDITPTTPSRFGNEACAGGPVVGAPRARSTLGMAGITMAAMAALGVRSASLPFARSPRRRCKGEVSANPSEQARTPASLCHAEGRGFESHHPLSKSPAQAGFFVACVFVLDGAGNAIGSLLPIAAHSTA
jgi:hypothetical protein